MSKNDLSFDINLFYELFSYWFVTKHTFVFHWGMMTQILLDVAAILGLRFVGDNASTVYASLIHELWIEFSKNT